MGGERPDIPPLRIGVLGMGRAFVLMAPAFRADPRCRLVAAADPRDTAQRLFEAEFGGRAFATAEDVLADPDVELVYIATPHQHHARQTIAAARAGKHVIVEKPMAITLEECAAMNAAAREAGVHLLVGPSHSYDAPVALAAGMIESGEFGAVRMVTALNYTDFLYRPRTPEELDTAQGGGVVFSQAAHQIDVVRRLVGRPVVSVSAQTGAWDPARPTEGAYSALLRFAGGATASLVYSGYGHYDSDALMGWISELGAPKDPKRHGWARRQLAAASHPETELKTQRTYGGSAARTTPPATHHEHFGLVIASCERADLRLTPSGVTVHGNEAVIERPAPVGAGPRNGVIDELWAALRLSRPPLHSGAWGAANLTVCQAILDSSRLGREIRLQDEDMA